MMEFFDMKIDDDLEYRELMEKKDYFKVIKYINLHVYLKFFKYLNMTSVKNMKKKRDFHIALDGIFIKSLYPNLYKFNSIFIRTVPGYLLKFNNINDKIQIPLEEQCIPNRHNNDIKKYRLKWGEKIKVEVEHNKESCPRHNTIIRKIGIRYIMEKLNFKKLSNTNEYEILFLEDII